MRKRNCTSISNNASPTHEFSPCQTKNLYPMILWYDTKAILTEEIKTAPKNLCMVILVKISYNYPHPPPTPSTTYPLSNNNYILQLSKEIQRTPKKETAVPPSTPTKQTAEHRMISRASLSHLSQSAAKQQNPPASLNLWLINTIKLESFAALSGRKSAYSPSVPPSPSLPYIATNKYEIKWRHLSC